MLAFIAMLLPRFCFAHKLSDSYLTINVSGSEITGNWDIALRDLENAIGLDANDDGSITWGELRSRRDQISEYALSRLSLETDGQKQIPSFKDFLVEHHSDGAYAVVRFAAKSPGAFKYLKIGYRALFEFDPQHRGLLNLQHEGKSQLAVFSPEHDSEQFEVAAAAPFSRQFTRFLGQGVWHIWTGMDHILFLVALLLPAVLQRTGWRWVVVEDFRSAALNVVKVVTAFTIAHSITLTLATLGIVHLPSRWVESAIAVSVVLAALNNIVPLFRGRGWWVAFGFGLIHGFGFANVLADLSLARGTLAVALLAFNLGVETGQIVIVAAFLPMAYTLRQTWIYQSVTLRFGSVCVALIASMWFAERWFDFKILPF